jgi:acyl carrier protein phosphodiesterase
MNYLAHILLAGPTVEAQLGGLFGDFSKPGAIAHFSPLMQREILLHRAIDSFTDSHPVVLAAKALFRAHTRRYSGIILDVFYDHVLAQHWHHYCTLDLSAFLDKFYREMEDFTHLFPEKFAQLKSRLVAEDWLGSYRTFAGVEIAIRRLSTRLSTGGAAMQAGVEDLCQNYENFCAGFTQFFPALMTYVAAQRAHLVTAAILK